MCRNILKLVLVIDHILAAFKRKNIRKKYEKMPNDFFIPCGEGCKIYIRYIYYQVYLHPCSDLETGSSLRKGR